MASCVCVHRAQGREHQRHEQAAQADAQLERRVHAQRVARARHPLRKAEATREHATHEAREHDGDGQRRCADHQTQQVQPHDLVDQRSTTARQKHPQQRQVSWRSALASRLWLRGWSGRARFDRSSRLAPPEQPHADACHPKSQRSGPPRVAVVPLRERPRFQGVCLRRGGHSRVHAKRGRKRLRLLAVHGELSEREEAIAARLRQAQKPNLGRVDRQRATSQPVPLRHDVRQGPEWPIAALCAVFRSQELVGVVGIRLRVHRSQRVRRAEVEREGAGLRIEDERGICAPVSPFLGDPTVRHQRCVATDARGCDGS